MNANPVKSTRTSTNPQLSERAGADACLLCWSGVVNEGAMSLAEGDCFQSSESMVALFSGATFE